MLRKVTLLLLIAILIATIVTVPALAQVDPITAQSFGKRDGRAEATRGGQCFWNGFWAGLTLSSYKIEPLQEMPSNRLRALEDKPGPYAAAYILGYQIGYRETCIKTAGTGNLVGRVTILIPLLILYYLSSG